MAFKRRKDDEPKGSAKRSLLGRGGSRDPFEHLQEEREKLEDEEQPWFLTDDDNAEDFKVEAGISSNISNTDLADPSAGGEPDPVAVPSMDELLPSSSESEQDGSSSVFEDEATFPATDISNPPTDISPTSEDPPGPDEWDEPHVDATPSGPAAVLEDLERNRTEIDGTAEPDRQGAPSPSALVHPDEAGLSLSPTEEPTAPPPLARDAAAPIFDLPDHSAEPIRAPDVDNPPSPTEARLPHDEPVGVKSLEVEVDDITKYLGRPDEALADTASPYETSTYDAGGPPDIDAPAPEPEPSQPPVSDTPSQGLVAALPAVDAPQPSESPEGDAAPLERTLVQAFRDVVAQAPPAPPLEEPDWPTGVDLQPEQPAHGASPQRVEPRKPRRPPRRPQGF